MKWLTDPPASISKPRPSIVLAPTGDRPVIYRNFIDGTTPRAIGVGFPGGINLAYLFSRIDPLGFPLERFDAVGRLRDRLTALDAKGAGAPLVPPTPVQRRRRRLQR